MAPELPLRNDVQPDWEWENGLQEPWSARRLDELMQAILEEMLANADVNVGLAFSLTTQFENVLGSHETHQPPSPWSPTSHRTRAPCAQYRAAGETGATERCGPARFVRPAVVEAHLPAVTPVNAS